MPTELHLNVDRGHVDHGWLRSAHSFSFAEYFNPDRMHFGALLVLNEDVIQPGGGFGEHGHENMEILTIPLSGSLSHADSMGNQAVIQAGEVQIMSAGNGIRHSEQNASNIEAVHLLQIWITPNQLDLPTRYEQLKYDATRLKNAFYTVVAPDASPDALRIHQDAYVDLGRFEVSHTFSKQQRVREHGTFLFVINGEIRIVDTLLRAGDAITIWDSPELAGEILTDAFLIAIEIPMNQ